MPNETGIVFERRPQISVKDLMSGVPVRNDVKEEVPIYQGLAKQKMRPFVAQGQEATRYLVCGPAVDGYGINALLYAAAPYKGFGFDTYDITNDWRSLYEPYNAKRLTHHRGLPNWHLFEGSRVDIVDAIERGSASKKRPPYRKDLFVPVMSWNVAGDGKKTWNFELDEQTIACLTANIGTRVKSTDRLNPLVGLLYNAAYSPDITNNRESWPTHRGYSVGSKSGQSMGPTQTLPLVLINANELLESSLTKRLEEHCQTERPITGARALVEQLGNLLGT